MTLTTDIEFDFSIMDFNTHIYLQGRVYLGPHYAFKLCGDPNIVCVQQDKTHVKINLRNYESTFININTSTMEINDEY